MNVSGISGTDMQCGGVGMTPGMGNKTDEVSRNLQKQIDELQQQMKELSANQDTPPEIKMRKRQELQKKISELQMQLRQHQIEVRREEAQEKKEKASEENIFDSCQISEEGRKQSAGLSAGSMEALISADASMKQAGVHGSTAQRMENRVGVLETEIARDKGGPGDASAAKEEELAKVKAKAEEATASQMESLKQANDTASTAAEADRENADEDRQTVDEKKEKSGQYADVAGQTANTVTDRNTLLSGEEADRTDGEEGQAAQAQRSVVYRPVDVRI